MGICGMNTTNGKKVNIQSSRSQTNLESISGSNNKNENIEENFKDFEEYNSNNKKII